MRLINRINKFYRIYDVSHTQLTMLDLGNEDALRTAYEAVWESIVQYGEDKWLVSLHNDLNTYINNPNIIYKLCNIIKH